MRIQLKTLQEEDPDPDDDYDRDCVLLSEEMSSINNDLKKMREARHHNTTNDHAKDPSTEDNDSR